MLYMIYEGYGDREIAPRKIAPLPLEDCHQQIPS